MTFSPMDGNRHDTSSQATCLSQRFQRRAKSSGLNAHPCLEPLAMLNRGEQVLPVRTIAVGLAYSNLIICMKEEARPITSKKDQRYCHSKQSKTFIASSEKTVVGGGGEEAPCIMCSNLLKLSEARLNLMKPVWSHLMSLVIRDLSLHASNLASIFIPAFRRDKGL